LSTTLAERKTQTHAVLVRQAVAEAQAGGAEVIPAW
jgi:hypothetical protein